MIKLVPVGEIEEDILKALKEGLRGVLGRRVEIAPAIELAKESLDQRRGQYLARLLLAFSPTPSQDERFLLITDEDIFAPGLNFVFGEADALERRAIISLRRLREEFYALTPNKALLKERALKEAVHELGHTYYLQHCPNPACVMYFSNSLKDTDFKGWNFCPKCREKLEKQDEKN